MADLRGAIYVIELQITSRSTIDAGLPGKPGVSLLLHPTALVLALSDRIGVGDTPPYMNPSAPDRIRTGSLRRERAVGLTISPTGARFTAI